MTDKPAASESAEVETLGGYRPELQTLPTRKIAIYGTCPSRGQGPINDISWETWTIGPGGKNCHRWERLFEVHHEDSWPEGFGEYLHELKQEKPPKIIYTESPMPDWPANVVLPKQQLFNKYGRMWFSSTISYALAMALEENVTELGVYGIDLESGEEYRSQYMGAKYFLNLARLAGVNITMPKGCGLLRDPNPYPDAWETHLAMTLDAKMEWLRGMVASKREQHGQLAAEINHIEGEIGAFEFLKNIYVIHGEDPGRRAPAQAAKESIETKVDKVLAHLQHTQGYVNNSG